VILVRLLWSWLKGLPEQAKQGGKILADPKAYGTKVLVPQVLSYGAKVGVIAIFMPPTRSPSLSARSCT